MAASGLSSAKSGSMAKPVPVAPARSWRWWPVAAAVIAGLVGGAALMRGLGSPAATDALRLHAFLLPPEGSYLTGGLALSPDGRTLAFVAADANGERQLWIRQLDSSRAQPLEGTSGASDPFWSPSGAELAFFANDQLKRIAIGGGGATVICEAGIGAGGTWNADGVIVFQPHQQGRLMQVAATGGLPEPGDDARRRRRARRITSIRRSCPTAGTSSFTSPARSAGFTSASSDRASDRSCSIPTRRCRPAPPRRLVSTPTSGHLLYVRDRVLMARPFDAGSRAVTGEPHQDGRRGGLQPAGRRRRSRSRARCWSIGRGSIWRWDR